MALMCAVFGPATSKTSKTLEPFGSGKHRLCFLMKLEELDGGREGGGLLTTIILARDSSCAMHGRPPPQFRILVLFFAESVHLIPSHVPRPSADLVSASQRETTWKAVFALFSYKDHPKRPIVLTWLPAGFCCSPTHVDKAPAHATHRAHHCGGSRIHAPRSSLRRVTDPRPRAT